MDVTSGSVLGSEGPLLSTMPRGDTQVGLGRGRAEARLAFYTRKGAHGQGPAAEATGVCRVVGSPGTGVSRVPAHPAPHCPPNCVATVLQVPLPWHACQLQEPRDRVDPVTHSHFRPVSCSPTSPPRRRTAGMEGLGAHQPPSVSYAGGGLSGNGTGCTLGPCMAPRPTPGRDIRGSAHEGHRAAGPGCLWRNEASVPPQEMGGSCQAGADAPSLWGCGSKPQAPSRGCVPGPTRGTVSSTAGPWI